MNLKSCEVCRVTIPNFILERLSCEGWQIHLCPSHNFKWSCHWRMNVPSAGVSRYLRVLLPPQPSLSTTQPHPHLDTTLHQTTSREPSSITRHASTSLFILCHISLMVHVRFSYFDYTGLTDANTLALIHTYLPLPSIIFSALYLAVLPYICLWLEAFHHLEWPLFLSETRRASKTFGHCRSLCGSLLCQESNLLPSSTDVA